MKTRIFVGIFLAVCILFIPLVAQPVTDAQKAEIEMILTEAHKEIVDGLNKMDIESFMKYVSEDFQERVAGGNIAANKKAGVEGFLKGIIAGRKSQSYIQDRLIINILNPDLAYVVQVGGMSWVTDRGRHGGLGTAGTYIWKKEQSGWKIVHWHESWW